MLPVRPVRAAALPALVLALLVLVLPLPRAHAAEPPQDQRIPLRENYSPGETALAVGLVTIGSAAMLLGPGLLGSPPASMGAPESDSLDARLSRGLYQADGTDRRMLWRVPDILGSRVIPFLPGLVYGASTLSLAFADRPLWPARDLNPDHRLVAYLETLGWTYVLTGVFKHTVGRPRPYTAWANNHPELASSAAGDDGVSFFSGHASGSFAAGAFVARDASNYLHRFVLDDEGPATRFLVGTLLPYTLGYGIPAVVAVSRVVDQQHWPSDVVIGGLVGAVVANLVYDTHFDDQGRPRRRHARAGEGAGVDLGRVVPVVEALPEGGHHLALALVGGF